MKVELSQEEIEEILEDQIAALESTHIGSFDHDVSSCACDHFKEQEGWVATRQAIIKKLAPMAREA